MKDEKDLIMKYVVIKLDDIKRFMSFDRQQIFWSLFWEMIDSKEIHEKADKIYNRLWNKEVMTKEELLVVPKQEEEAVVVPSTKPEKIRRKAKDGRKLNRGIKISYLQKYIQRGNFKTFCLEDFFRVFPKQRRNDKLNGFISDLIRRRVIVQLGKEKFRVIR